MRHKFNVVHKDSKDEEFRWWRRSIFYAKLVGNIPFQSLVVHKHLEYEELWWWRRCMIFVRSVIFNLPILHFLCTSSTTIFTYLLNPYGPLRVGVMN
jgi:hypothetical protein